MTAVVAQEGSPEPTALDRDPMLLIGWLAMVFGMFMAILDIQIVASSLTDIQAGLAASPDEISWVQTSYLIAEIIMIPLSGYLARLLSTRVLFIVSATGFTLASLACALAWDLQSLILFRILQGFIGGGMIPSAFASIYRIFPPKHHNSANVVLGLIVTLAPAMGPTLGGYITTTLSWEWLFLVNLIPGLIVVFTVMAMPDIDQADRSLGKGFDMPGLILMALFLGGLEFVLDEGPRQDWFDDHHIVIWSIISAVSGVLFFYRALTYRQPLVDLRVFANRNFLIGCVVGFMLGLGLFGSIYTIPQFLAQVRGYNALQIGTVLSVSGLFMLLGAPIGGKLANMLDLRWVLLIGAVLATLGLYLNAGLTADSGYDELFWPQAIRGMGFVIMIVASNGMAFGTLPPESLNNGSGLFNLSRNLGGAMGLAAINTLLDNRTAFHWDHIAAWINPSRPEYQAFVAQAQLQSQGMISGDGATVFIAQLAQQQAAVMAFNDVHLVMAFCFALVIPLLMFANKARAGVAAGH